MSEPVLVYDWNKADYDARNYVLREMMDAARKPPICPIPSDTDWEER